MAVSNEEMCPFSYKLWTKHDEIFNNEINNEIEGCEEEFRRQEKFDETVDIDFAKIHEKFSSDTFESGLPVEDIEKTLKNDKILSCSSTFKVLNGKDLNDIPAIYSVPTLQPYEFACVGVWIDMRIVPGFKYRVRPIESKDYKDDYLFNGNGLSLQSIGCGYSRRITFVAPPGHLNDNGNYFYSDSRKYGFAFQLELISVKEKYTIYDISHHPIGHLEIIKIQYPQEELSHKVLDDKSVEKSARVRALAKVEWFDINELCVVSVRGTAISIKKQNSRAEVMKIVGVTISGHLRRNYTLYPGVDNKKRCITVSGAAYNDVPITYSVVGLEIHELPVIGTYIDPRIIPGFYYKVRPINSKNYLFNGRTLRLMTIGLGYSKRLTFAPDKNCLNSNQNYFWTDSMPSGFGFELRAIHCDNKFKIYVKDRCLGYASVFRVDDPQYEEKELLEKNERGTVVTKFVHVEMTCLVTLRWSENEKDISHICDGRVMRISGTAVLEKCNSDKEAKILRVEDIGLDSQLSLLFINEQPNLVFIAH